MSRAALTVSAGTGPVEVRRFVALLADALGARLVKSGATIEHVVAHGVELEPRSIDLVFSVPDGASDPVTRWLGTHALVATSALRGKRARRRWFAGVSRSLLDPAASARRDLDPNDVAFRACRSSGAGGQHVNRTASAVRAVHRPTGLCVRVESHRSQHRNKQAAIEGLELALCRLSMNDEKQRRHTRRATALRVERGRPVATWCLDRNGRLRMEGESRDAP